MALTTSGLPDWLTRKEAAEYMRMSPTTLACWAYKRGLVFKKFGSRVLYAKRDVIAWMESK